jgi:hypothetical protein
MLVYSLEDLPPMMSGSILLSKGEFRHIEFQGLEVREFYQTNAFLSHKF